MGTDNIITLFFLIVAALIFLNLRSVLGKRTGNEKPPYDPFSQRRAETAPTGADDGKVITLPKRPTVETENRYEAIDNFAAPGTELNNALRKVFDTDPTFNPAEFVDGARIAYEMIVTAFAEGDRKALKSLLSNEVFEGFNQALNDREKAGEKVKMTFVGIEKSEMTSAVLDGSEVTITMKIVSQLIKATYDKAGELVDGNADSVTEVTDRWAFSRDTRSRDPNWKLVMTQSEG
jgi:predicted lipid-binding transport protein (Tim44 family)